MRLRFSLLLAGIISLIAPGVAAADFLHTVTPGESLTSIAAADGLSIGQLAAANGLSPTAQLVSGSGIQIPPQGGGVASSSAGASSAGVPSSAAAPSSSGSYVVQPGDTLSGIASRAGLTLDQLAAANGLDPMGTLQSGSVLQLSGAGGTGSSQAQSSGSSGSSGGSYVVQPGDTLSGIASRAGVSVDQLAAANGLDPMGTLLSGSVLQLSGAGGSSASSAISGDGDGDGDDPGSTAVSSPASSASYVVQPGDTLSAIASRAGMSVDQLAAANGLNPLGVLPSGAVLSLPGGGGTASAQPTSSAVATAQPVGSAAQGSPTSPPYPTPQTVSPSDVGSIAAANGVPPALAQAIAYQESGFNNGLVSSSDARGVMQILPGTWNYIQQDLTPGASPLAPASATDNVRGGVELLHSLLNATGGNAALAAAGYYQGLPSVQQNGMYPDTQQYVNDVLALQQRFNGGG